MKCLKNRRFIFDLKSFYVADLARASQSLKLLRGDLIKNHHKLSPNEVSCMQIFVTQQQTTNKNYAGDVEA